MRCSVLGAGGAIGGHLVKALLDQGHAVRAVDIKESSRWWQHHKGAHNLTCCDLRKPTNASIALDGADWAFDLAENMGGIGFITNNRVDCAESVEIGIALLRAATRHNLRRFFFASSACVYPTHLQDSLHVPQLEEHQAWPAQPEVGYGFSKLFMEELCGHYGEERGLTTRVARYHNVFGEHSSWNDGREKAPAAICRKVALAKLHEDEAIKVWGDGQQMRSYLHVDDCVRGTLALMKSTRAAPLNIGSDRAVSVNELVQLICKAADYPVETIYDDHGAQGVRGRNANTSQAQKWLSWHPQLSLEEGLERLYGWVEAEVRREQSSVS